MNEKEKENIKEAEEEEEEEEGIWVREQRKRKRKRKRSRRRRRREEELADWPDLAPASDGGRPQRQRAKVNGQTSVIFFFHCWRVGAVRSRVEAVLALRQRRVREAKKKKMTLAGHQNPASRTRSGVRHVSDIDTMPKMACPCNLDQISRFHQTSILSLRRGVRDIFVH